jgi:hypothetical protein
MILYERHKAPPEVQLRFHIRDKFGVDIFHSVDYDPETGYGHIKVPGTENLKEYYKPGGYVAIELTSEELHEIDSVASKITIQGARYPEDLEKRTGL